MNSPDPMMIPANVASWFPPPEPEPELPTITTRVPPLLELPLPDPPFPPPPPLAETSGSRERVIVKIVISEIMERLGM